MIKNVDRADDNMVIQNYLTKFKESLIKSIFSPQCHYNESLECFISLDQHMGYSLGSAEMITSTQTLEDLVEIVGTEGIVWLIGQIELDICTKVTKLVQIVKVSNCFSV